MAGRRFGTGTQHALRASESALAASGGRNGTTEPCGAQTMVLEDFPSPKLARQLSPNGRVHWAVRAEAKREAAHRIACECLLQRVYAIDGPVRLTFRWVFPTAGRHDLDNLIATC